MEMTSEYESGNAPEWRKIDNFITKSVEYKDDDGKTGNENISRLCELCCDCGNRKSYYGCISPNVFRCEECQFSTYGGFPVNPLTLTDEHLYETFTIFDIHDHPNTLVDQFYFNLEITFQEIINGVRYFSFYLTSEVDFDTDGPYRGYIEFISFDNCKVTDIEGGRSVTYVSDRYGDNIVDSKSILDWAFSYPKDVPLFI